MQYKMELRTTCIVVLRRVGKNEEAAAVGRLVVTRRVVLVDDIVDDLCSC